MTLHIVGGARPNFVKIAPVMAALDALAAQRGDAPLYQFVHTGQHHADAMSDGLMRTLGMPEPHLRIEPAQGSPEARFGHIMTRYADILRQSPPDLVIVAGDVDSTLAAALAARRVGVPVAHLEAGLRCADRTMPEEINRRATDAIAEFFFTTTASAGDNLVREGQAAGRIFFVGNTMIDSLRRYLPHSADRMATCRGYGVESRGFYFLTLHRPAMVDKPEVLEKRLRQIALRCNDAPILFSVHPRTAKSLEGFNLPHPICSLPPLPYPQSLTMIAEARAVITDSGGISEECTALGVPCVVARDVTERPEVEEVGTATLVGTDLAGLDNTMASIMDSQYKKGSVPEKWDGRAGNRVVEVIRDFPLSLLRT